MNELTPVMNDYDRQQARERSSQNVRPPASVPGHGQMRFLGRGAFGEVWLAVEENTGRQVAIKFYAHRDAADWPQMSREVEKLRFLFSDRHVVQLLHVGWDADPPYFIMEYMEQGSLEEHLKRQGLLPASEAIGLLRDIATGLVHAHRKGILHCDLKPDNVLLDHDSRPRLADFGQARLPHENVPALGTLFYMAPEQADLKAKPDPRWDVYALGAVLYRMLTGAPPFQSSEVVTALSRGTSLRDRLDQYRQFLRNAPKPSAHRPLVDRSLAEIIDRCLAFDPAARYASVQEVINALDSRAMRRARRGIQVLGIVGPALLVLVMALVGADTLRTAVHESHQAVVARALESDRFAAHFVAEQFALDIDKRWRILEYSAGDSALHRLLERWESLPAQSPERPELQKSIQDWISKQHERFNLQFRPGTEARSWLLIERSGLQLARSPKNDASLYQNWAFRDVFHGLGQDMDPKSFDPSKVKPIHKRYRSRVFRSRITGNLMTALAVPIRSPSAGQEPIGVLCMTIELGSFADFLGSDNQFAILVDTKPDNVTKKPGLILEHRTFDTTPECAREPHYVAPEVLDFLEKLRKHRLQELAQQSAQAPIWVDSIHSNEEDDFLVNYQDPVPSSDGTSAENRWLAACEPVIILHGRERHQMDTGWAVIVQERYATAVAPVTKLSLDLRRIGWIGLVLVVLIITALWGFVLLVLNESTRAKLTRFLRRYAGLASERPVNTLVSAQRTAPPKDMQATAPYTSDGDPPEEWLKQTDQLNR